LKAEESSRFVMPLWQQTYDW